jgi:peptidylamidoglycolate lyase
LYIFEGGEEGDGEGEFDLAYDLDVDKQGNLWVAERGNERIQKFDAKVIKVKKNNDFIKHRTITKRIVLLKSALFPIETVLIAEKSIQGHTIQL